MVTWEFDEDGDLDVISASTHRFGIWWHEQGADGPDNWKTHELSKALYQTHDAAFTDMKKDGQPDRITGMRYFAHQGKRSVEHKSESQSLMRITYAVFY